MRRRSDRERMLKRVDPWKHSLKPGSEPVVWHLPGWVEFGSPEWDTLLQEQVRSLNTFWLAPGCDLHMELVGDYESVVSGGETAQIRFTAVRRDTNSLRDARWLSTTPERTPQ